MDRIKLQQETSRLLDYYMMSAKYFKSMSLLIAEHAMNSTTKLDTYKTDLGLVISYVDAVKTNIEKLYEETTAGSGIFKFHPVVMGQTSSYFSLDSIEQLSQTLAGYLTKYDADFAKVVESDYTDADSAAPAFEFAQNLMQRIAGELDDLLTVNDSLIKGTNMIIEALASATWTFDDATYEYTADEVVMTENEWSTAFEALVNGLATIEGVNSSKPEGGISLRAQYHATWNDPNTITQLKSLLPMYKKMADNVIALRGAGTTPATAKSGFFRKEEAQKFEAPEIKVEQTPEVKVEAPVFEAPKVENN